MCSLLTPGMTSILPKSRSTLWSTVTKSPTRRPTRRLRNLRLERRPPTTFTKHYQTYLFDVFACSPIPSQGKKHTQLARLPRQGDEVQLSNQWLQKQPTAASEGKAQSPHEGDLCLLQSGFVVVLKLCILSGVQK